MIFNCYKINKLFYFICFIFIFIYFILFIYFLFNLIFFLFYIFYFFYLIYIFFASMYFYYFYYVILSSVEYVIFLTIGCCSAYCSTRLSGARVCDCVRSTMVAVCSTELCRVCHFPYDRML